MREGKSKEGRKKGRMRRRKDEAKRSRKEEED